MCMDCPTIPLLYMTLVVMVSFVSDISKFISSLLFSKNLLLVSLILCFQFHLFLLNTLLSLLFSLYLIWYFEFPKVEFFRLFILDLSSAISFPLNTAFTSTHTFYKLYFHLVQIFKKTFLRFLLCPMSYLEVCWWVSNKGRWDFYYTLYALYSYKLVKVCFMAHVVF